MNKKRCGFTLVELLIVTSVISVLMVASYIPLNRMWLNNQIDISESEIRELTSGLKSYFTDYGGIIIADDINYETTVNEILDVLNRRYLSYELQLDAIATDKKSMVLSSKIKTDPWRERYKLYFYTYEGVDHTGIPGLVIISSNGVDGESSIGTYKEGNYGDDICAVIQPK